MKKKIVGEDFIVTPRMRELAQKNQWVDPDSQREAFIDYHRSKGSLFFDVEAAFRTWLRNATRFQKERELRHRSKAEAQRERIAQFLNHRL